MAARRTESGCDRSTRIAPPGLVRPTKLAPPDASRLVHRRRLHDVLDATGSGVVWVTGPAGSGKSSLAATWCEACGRPTIWYRVDASDADVANLFEWLSRAVPDLSDERARDLPQWSAEQGIDPAAFAVRFFSAFFDLLEPDAVVVFDNVHEAAASAVFAQALAIAGDCRRRDVMLVLNSREAPLGALLQLASTEDPRVHLALASFVIGHSCWMGRMRDSRAAARLAARALNVVPLHPSATVHTCLWIGIAAYTDGRAADKEIQGFVDRAQALIDAADLRVWSFHTSLQKSAEAMGIGDIASFDKLFERSRALCPGNRGTRYLMLMSELMQFCARAQWREGIEYALDLLRESPDMGGYPFGAAVVRLQMALFLRELVARDASLARLIHD